MLHRRSCFSLSVPSRPFGLFLILFLLFLIIGLTASKRIVD